MYGQDPQHVPMAQQNYLFTPSCYRQGPGTSYPDNEISRSQEESARIGSQAMDRRQLSNGSSRTDHSGSAWSDISWNTNITPVSPMSTWEEVSPIHIKGENNQYEWEQNVDSMEYHPTSSPGFQNPMLQPSSFTEATTASRPTPTSLNWNVHSRLLELYKFVVGKGGKDPYFQLLDGCKVTEQTPARVFLDFPRYELPLQI